MDNQFINGSGAIGTGFNIYGKFDRTGSFKERIFDLKEGKQIKVINDKTYAIPQNVDILDNQKYSGVAKVFESRQKYEENFSASAKVEGTMFGFTASAEATFDRTVTSDTTTSFATYTAKMTQYALKLQSTTANLSKQFTNSEEYKNLPADFEESDPANQVKFFQFFTKFGTHYVNYVEMGGLIDYSIAVKKSKTYSKEEITAKITAEYGDVFKAEGEASSTVINTQWFSDTQRKIYAEGGNNSILNVVSPSYGSRNKKQMTEWLVTVNDNPAIASFELIPIANLFEGHKASAIREAATAYMRHSMKMNATNAMGSIYVRSKAIAPDTFNKPAGRFGRFEIVVLNKKTLAVLLAKSYPLNRPEGDVDYGYNAALPDIRSFRNNKEAIFMLNVVYSMPYLNINQKYNSEFIEFLKSCGASDKTFKAWADIAATPTDICPWGVRYMLIGVCDTMENSGLEQLFAIPSKDKEQSLTMYSFLEPRYKSTGELYGYTPMRMEIPPAMMMSMAPAAEELEAIAEEAE